MSIPISRRRQPQLQNHLHQESGKKKSDAWTHEKMDRVSTAGGLKGASFTPEFSHAIKLNRRSRLHNHGTVWVHWL